MKKRSLPVKSGSTIFLKIVIILLASIVLLLCTFVLPRGIHSDTIGAYRPILIGMYIPAIPFFIALLHAWKLLSLIEKSRVFSHESATSLGYIQYSGFIICALYTLGMPYIFYVADMDDAPGVALLGFIFIGGSLAVGTMATVFQKVLQNVIDIKSENDLTV